MESVVFAVMLVVVLIGIAIIMGMCRKSISRRRFKTVAVRAGVFAVVCFVLSVVLYAFNCLNLVQSLILVGILVVFDVAWLAMLNWARKKRRKDIAKTRSLLH